MSNQPPDADTYALVTEKSPLIKAPDLSCIPPVLRHYRPRIALIGAGGIASAHLDAYRTAGFDVAAICNRRPEKAQALRDEYFPKANVTGIVDELLADESIEVFDVTSQPVDRLPLMEKALLARKYVLSQKSFVLDLVVGERLIQMAMDNGVKLAVNQNGRWAPHMAYMREAAVHAGLIGDVTGFRVAIHWDHSWIAGTTFEAMEDLILHDFAIHWFDFLASIVGDRVCSVHAMQSRAAGQTVRRR